MIDTHAHLYFEAFDADRGEVLQRARQAGASAVINIGIDSASSRQAVQLSLEHPWLFAAAGLHPASRTAEVDRELQEIETLAAGHPGRVVAVGEIGLDYHWKDVAPDDQRARLKEQLGLARRLRLPVVFHCREALEDLLSLLEGEADLPAGVFHCFSGGPAEAARALQLGFHLSFAGNVTFPKALELQAAARSVPAERLLLETDCPFLAPQPCRGKRNEPAFARHTLEALARLKGLAPEVLEGLTDRAAVRLFNLPAAAASESWAFPLQ